MLVSLSVIEQWHFQTAPNCARRVQPLQSDMNFMSAKRCLMIGEGFSMFVRHQQQSRKASDRAHMISSCLRLTWPRLVRPWMNWWPMPRLPRRQWAKMKESPDLGYPWVVQWCAGPGIGDQLNMGMACGLVTVHDIFWFQVSSYQVSTISWLIWVMSQLERNPRFYG